MDYSSLKAPYRPGKAPTPVKMARTASLVSLPSPPPDDGHLHQDDHRLTQDGIEVDGGIEDAPRRRSFVPSRGVEDADEEVDQLDSDTEDEMEVEHKERVGSLTAAPLRRHPTLGSPANLVGGGGASRRQLLNPFLPAPTASSSSSSSSHPQQPAISASSLFASTSSHNRPDHSHNPHASPTRRRRADPDRIRLVPSSYNAVTPPRKTREELAEERARQDEEEAKQRKRSMMGWDDPENPFVEREEEMASRIKDLKPMKRPETITLVKYATHLSLLPLSGSLTDLPLIARRRGQRISTSVPFTAVLTSTSADDDPFTFTEPRLLFPPKPSSSSASTMPSTPPSKFLEALRAAGASERKPTAVPPQPQKADDAQSNHLPPTPVTLKRKVPEAGANGARVGQYKKMRTLGTVAEGGLR